MRVHPLLNLPAMIVVASALLIDAGSAQTPPTAAVALPPVPISHARIWFYRELNPYQSMATPQVRLNGAAVGVSRPGEAFYRDVPPGHYNISADSYLADRHQTQDVDVTPGQEIFAKILPSDPWVFSVGNQGGGYHRETFYVWLYPPETARPMIAQSWLSTAAAR